MFSFAKGKLGYPRFGMAGAEHVGQGQAGDSAGATPVGQHGFAEFLLADALAYHAFDFGQAACSGL
ncbi:hypothetical protein HMI48_12575 [Acidithiobacillus ferrooxidans]|uniref:hypothetical protein n=1 Tax=Acidithiobacillus ferrooxidans TaxID=920 RepID=UPI00059F4933|nr:hypothetical protein [Acidithiobacillus ferrooxidans]MBU2774667.1 hypothetical protein [Acidithiobacillus ferrooxidans]BDB12771.1 hypothetical protein ANFP_00910 [Acidithiobacillus ferrooxidans]